MKKAILTQNARTILEKRYLKKDETPEDMFWRVSQNVASADKLYGATEDDLKLTRKLFYDMMVNLDFLPNSPCLRGAGRELQQCVACFVLPVEDDLESIFDAIKTAAMIHKTGGGTGYSFSRLRPKGDIVASTGNNAGGPVSFMKVFAEASREITQGGVRLGANMGILRVDHPDILEFIHCKDDGKTLTNFNISVAVTDKFMQAVKDNTDYELINPRTKQITKTLKARQVFDEIAQSAWKTGDPGIVFIDTINRFNPTPNEIIEATNPCVTGDTKILTDKGEIEIQTVVNQTVKIWNGECWSFVIPKITGKNKKILRIKLASGKYIDCTLGHRFILENDLKVDACALLIGDKLKRTIYPDNTISDTDWVVSVKDIKKMAANVYCFNEPINHTGIFNGILTGQCGEQPLLPFESCVLGSINLSHMVKDGNVDYDKLGRTVENAVYFLDNVIDVNNYPTPEIERKTKQNRKIGLGVMGWADMLVQLGVSYNSDEALELAQKVMETIDTVAFDRSIELGNIKGHFPNIISFDGNQCLRNAARTTIAPTGTISIIANCSGGIEPFFALAYERQTLFDADGATKTLTVVNEHFEQLAKDSGFYSKKLMQQVAKSGSIQHIDDIPDDIKSLFVVAHDVSPEQHIKMQAAFQQETNNAISKTINMSNSATVQNVKDAYMLAWELGCKGITIYRDGCRMSQVLNVKKDEQEIKHRDGELQGVTYRSNTPLGKAYVTVNHNGNREPFEVFINIGKAGSDTTAFAEAIGRLISLVLRLPSKLTQSIRLEEIAHQLTGIGGTSSIGFGANRIRSLPDAIGQVLNKYLGNKNQIKGYDLCPECGHSLQWQEGCYKCLNCGYSRC